MPGKYGRYREDIHSLVVLTVDGPEKRGSMWFHLHHNVTIFWRQTRTMPCFQKADENSGAAWFGHLEDSLKVL